jgi:protein phosphatase
VSGGDVLARPAVHVTVAGASDPGRRRAETQDSFLVADLCAPVAEGPWRVSTDRDDSPQPARFDVCPSGFLAIVADGMGGAAAGAVASRLAVARVYGGMATSGMGEGRPTPDGFARRLRQAVEDANRALHAHAAHDPACEGMGTTMTAAGVLDGWVYVAQVGDSRAYLLRGGQAVQITRDQSLVQSMIDAGTLTEAQVETSGIASVLMQALGPRPSVEVDLTRQELRRGDLLLLCSDGLFRTTPDADLAAAVERMPDLAQLCAELVATANDRGGPDNVTVVAVRLDGDGLEPPRDGDPVGRAPYPPAG